MEVGCLPMPPPLFSLTSAVLCPPVLSYAPTSLFWDVNFPAFNTLRIGGRGVVKTKDPRDKQHGLLPQLCCALAGIISHHVQWRP